MEKVKSVSLREISLERQMYSCAQYGGQVLKLTQVLSLFPSEQRAPKLFSSVSEFHVNHDHRLIRAHDQRLAPKTVFFFPISPQKESSVIAVCSLHRSTLFEENDESLSLWDQGKSMVIIEMDFTHG